MEPLNESKKETVIETVGLSCKAGNRYLLKDINWQVEKGQHWLIYGMNGCGKTTLLSIIAGMKKHTHGFLQVFGEAYSAENILRTRRRIGFVSSSFFERFYKKEDPLHIVLSGKSGSFGMADSIDARDVRRAKALLREFHLADKIYRPFDMMSKGERQNVLLARALFSNPEILLLDEPTGGLDIYNRAHLYQVVKEMVQYTDITVLYVTHYLEEFPPVFAQCMLLKHGSVYAKGPTKDLITSECLSKFVQYPVSVREENGHYRTEMQVETNIRALLRGEKR